MTWSCPPGIGTAMRPDPGTQGPNSVSTAGPCDTIRDSGTGTPGYTRSGRSYNTSASPTLTLDEREDWGPILTCGTDDPGDVPVETILDLLRSAYRARLAVGLDTEFAGDLDFTPLGRTTLHLASLGILQPGDAQAPDGLALRVVVGPAALLPLGPWFLSDHRKVLFSASVDLHTLANSGVTVNHWVDILPFSRYCRPDGKEHGLKFHIQHTLGYRGMGEYRDNFFRHKIGVRGHSLKTREAIPIHEIVPGHLLWERMKRYAALDAKATAELYHRWRGDERW